MVTIGRTRVISTSKIKKIIATRKNRKEKGKRAVLLGSNPHSKGDLFSRSLWVFLANPEESLIIKKAMHIVIKINVYIDRMISSGADLSV